MLDLKRLEKNEEFKGKAYQEAYQADLSHRSSDPKLILEVLNANAQRKKIVQEVEEARARQNKVGQEIALRKRNKEDASELMEEMQKLSGELKGKSKQLDEIEASLNAQLLEIPNHLHKDVPIGKSESDNRVEKTVGSPPEMGFEALDHVDLGEKLDILDFERAGKVTGARFTFLKGAGAALERALIQFMMDVHSREHGYDEIIPPFIVNSDSMVGTGQFPKFRDDVFHLEGVDYHLIPTAEVPVTNIFRGEILSATDLPKSFCAYSPCFRSEAGSYGKDTRGLIRQHQFNKVELLKFTHPDESYEEHERLTSHAEKILEMLELSYRRVCLCSGDIGFSAAKCYDLEVWLPGQKAYREISSCSNFEDFQARRANIRFKDGPKAKPQFVHTLNGSGLAVGRTLIAILENYQQQDGSVRVPTVLQNYMGGMEVVRRN